MINSRRPVHLLVAGSLAGLLALTACGSDDDSSTGASRSDSSPTAENRPESDEESDEESGDETAAAGDDACAQLEEFDGSSQTFGPVQVYLPKEGLAEELEARLTPLTSVTPPAELAEAWSAWQGFLERQDAATAQLPAGGKLNDPALFEVPADVEAAAQQLRDWWFDSCV